MITEITRLPVKLKPDKRRVITRQLCLIGPDRVQKILKRISNLNDQEVSDILEEILLDFNSRHKNFINAIYNNYLKIEPDIPDHFFLNEKQKLLTGAFLTKEYSIQSAALFNPSMVPHPDQSGLEKGQKRFIISLRSTGEGHISSIEFRAGIADNKGHLTLNKYSEMATTGSVEHPENTDNENNYDLSFPEDSDLSERVIFPHSKIELMGMEDLRLVLFEDGKEITYFGTYTAYDGRKISPQLLETNDFRNFRIRTLMGTAAEDKGMALFPEKINGKYCMISRQGGENISIMFSDKLYEWHDHHLLLEPKYPFELAQMGNCGSPVKTPAGWLLLTHGVGPVRQYSISAALLDLNDPQKVIARLDRPLLRAEGDEREGYVPNVVYSCGGMLHDNILYLPYAMSDSITGFSWIDIKMLLNELTENK